MYIDIKNKNRKNGKNSRKMQIYTYKMSCHTSKTHQNRGKWWIIGISGTDSTQNPKIPWDEHYLFPRKHSIDNNSTKHNNDIAQQYRQYVAQQYDCV